MLGVLLIALGVGAGNFAISVAIGLRGVDAMTRIRVGVVFALFEGGMPVLGAEAGKGIAPHVGGAAHLAGGGLLIAIGCYQVIGAVRARRGEVDRGPIPTPKLLLTALALSVDNFVAGLALGALPVSIAVLAAVIASVSAALSLAGLEVARRLGPLIGERAELFGGIVLGGVGVCVMSGVLS